ncbi:hypothetical protein L6R29_02020 [Myxococcota bacterium]|nr:hypothetical protein [Myxococcota bacterium]
MKLQVYKQGKLVSFQGTNTLVVKSSKGFGWGCAGWVAAWFVPSFLQFPPWLGGLFFVGLVFFAVRHLISTGNQASLPIVEHLELDTTEHLLSIEAAVGEDKQVWDLPTSSLRNVQIRTLGLATGLYVELSPSLDLAFEMTLGFEDFAGIEPLSVYCHIQGIRETSDLEHFASSLSAMLGLKILLLMERGQKEARFFMAKEYPGDLDPLERLDSIEYPKWITDRLLGLEETPSSIQENAESEEASFFESIDEKEQKELLSETKTRKPRRLSPAQDSTLPFPAPLVQAAPPAAPTLSYQLPPKQTPPSPTADTPHHLQTSPPSPQTSQSSPQTSQSSPQTPHPRAKQSKPTTQAAQPSTKPARTLSRPAQPSALPQSPSMAPQEEAFRPPAPQASPMAPQEEAFHPSSPPAETFSPTAAYDTSIKELPWLTGESKGHWPEWSSFSSSQQSKPALSWPTWESQDPK